MKIYVASSFSRKPDVRDMHTTLRAAGHQITFDWTGEDATGMEGDALRSYMQRGAELDRRGVISSDAVVVIHDDRGRGMATEFGIALGLGVPTFVVGARVPQGEMKNAFYYLPMVTHVDTAAELLEALGELERWKAA